MKKKSLLLVVMLAVLAILLVGCQDVAPTLKMDNFEFVTEVGEESTIKPTIVYEGKETVTLKYVSSDPTVVEVDSATGKVTAKKVGSADVTISIEQFPEVKVVAKVNVEQTAKEEFVPTAISIVGNNTQVMGKTVQLIAAAQPESAFAEVIWTSSDASVASVDPASGLVTAVFSGQATITATSALDPEVKATLVFTVTEAGTDEEIAERVLDYVEGLLPEYVSGTIDLPQYPNELLEVSWEDEDGNPFSNGKYTVSADKDSIAKLVAKIEIGEETFERTIDIKVVLNLNENSFEKVALAKGHFVDYFDGVTNVTGNLKLVDEIYGAAVTWSSTSETVIAKNGTFTRPNDNVVVTLTAKIKAGDVEETLVKEVTAVGYTKAEKIAYMKSTGSLKITAAAYHLELPAKDNKFGATLTWTSSNTEVLTAAGKYANKDLAEATKVNLTAHVKYDVEGEANDIDEDVVLEVTVSPLTPVAKAAMTWQDTFELPVDHVAFGTDDVANQITGLPTEVDGYDVRWYGVNGEFSHDMEAQKFIMSYTPTYVYARFYHPDFAEVTVKFPVNIGIAGISEEGKQEIAFTARTGTFGGPTHDVKKGLPAVEGGTGTAYALGLSPVYIKATFDYVTGTAEEPVSNLNTYYFYFAARNYKVWTADMVEETEGKFYFKRVDEQIDDPNNDDPAVKITVSRVTPAARLAVNWASCARVYFNNTGKDIVLKLEDHPQFGFNTNAAAGQDQYPIFVVSEGEVIDGVDPLKEAGRKDSEGNLIDMKGNVVAEARTEIVVPAGAYVFSTAYLDYAILNKMLAVGNNVSVHGLII